MVLHQAAVELNILTNDIFFVTDKIKNGEVRVAYCPMGNILADFFTKPLQGSTFVWMQEKILNIPSCTSKTAPRSVLRNENKNNGENKNNEAT